MRFAYTRSGGQPAAALLLYLESRKIRVDLRKLPARLSGSQDGGALRKLHLRCFINYTHSPYPTTFSLN
jgi:hypothetical protein